MSEFCTHKVGSLRCVLRAHGPKYAHELQPASSVSVQTIDRQEAIERRLSDPVQAVVTALDDATRNESAPAQGSSVSTTETKSPESQTGVGTVGESA